MNHLGDTNKMVSDTPRTDEQINGKPCTRFEVIAGDSLRNASVPSEFARQLERKLNAANQRIKRLEEAGNNMAEWLAHSRNLGADPFLSETWNKAKEAKL